ncbi:MAG: tripartite tricarboxylate transporter substrate binding protein [Pseudomonadota bacterium]
MRSFRHLPLGLVLAALLCASGAAMSQAWPTRPIRVVVPYTAGGGADAVARPIFDRMSEILGQPVVMINRPGSNGEVGTTSVATAEPDGYTLVFASTGPNVNSIALGRDVHYTAGSFQPITVFVDSNTFLFIRASLPIQNLKELIAYAKANPGKLNYGTGGSGSAPQLALKSLNRAAGIDIKEIPYPGVAGATVDILADRIDLFQSAIGGLGPHIQSGKLRPIALVTSRRNSSFPDVPTIAEVVPGYTPVNSWLGLMAPAGTPKEIVDGLYRASVEAVRTPRVSELLRGMSLSIALPTPEVFAASIKSDIATWSEQFKAIGIGKE